MIRILIVFFLSIALFAHEKHDSETGEDIFDQTDISAVLSMSALYRNVADNEYESLYVPGVEALEKTYNKNRGFNLNYLEISLHTLLNNGVDLDGVIHVSEDTIEIGEAYFYKRLFKRIWIKGGKFRSSFGYINKFHHHRLYFTDYPLIFRAIFGSEGLSEKGLALSYNNESIRLQTEILQGENETSFGYGDASLFVLSLKYRLGESLKTGLSWARGRNSLGEASQIYNYFVKLSHGFYDFTNNITLEYFKKNEPANLEGFYAQTVLKRNGWGLGYKEEAILKSGEFNDLKARSFLLIYEMEEFARIALEYRVDDSLYLDGERKRVKEAILQINIPLGVHHHQ